MVLMASTRGLGPCSLGSSPNAPTSQEIVRNLIEVDYTNFNFKEDSKGATESAPRPVGESQCSDTE